MGLMDRRLRPHRPLQLFQDSLTISDRLPSEEEAGGVKHLLIRVGVVPAITDDEFAGVVERCTGLETAVLCGVEGLSDRSVVALARSAGSLRGLDVSGCGGVTDVGVQELVRQGLPLEWVRLGGIGVITDSSVSGLVRGCGRLVEIDVSGGRMLSGSGIGDVWVYGRRLRVLRVSGCIGLGDDGFPGLGRVVVHDRTDNLRVVDLGGCAKITDEGIAGLVGHGYRIQRLELGGCVLVSDRGLESVSGLGCHLDVLGLGGLGRITDEGIMSVSRKCRNLRAIDVSFCRRLTDLGVMELAGLESLQRISVVRVSKLTDNGVLFLAEHGSGIEQLHLSYCDKISLEAIHVAVRNLRHLRKLSVTGVPSFNRKGVQRFSDAPPSHYDAQQQTVNRVYTGENIRSLHRFLDKELYRKRECENRNIPFTDRSDDDRDLY